jgi:hypothetical protein
MKTTHPMTKSPRAEALRLAQQTLPAYSSKFSRQDFTQHQLFALLALKAFFKTDYRGVVHLLKDFAELRDDVGLQDIPHYSTLCYAAQRLLKGGEFVGLLLRATRRARQGGLIDEKPEAAVDATGLESRHTSRYFFKRAGRKPSAQSWVKLTVAWDTSSHFFTAATVTLGPRNDSPPFRPIVQQACLVVSWDRVLADAAFDRAANHRLAREDVGVRSTVIPLNRRNRGRKWPKTKDRRQMKQRFCKRKYGQRWQAASAISRHKRRLGSALSARSDAARTRETRLRVLTYNLMLLADTG